MKKNKKRGFTLIELLVSMVFISFVIVMSSTLFDKAIYSDRQIRQTVVENTSVFSDMDSFSSEAKNYIIFYKMKESGKSDADIKAYAKKNNLGETYNNYISYNKNSRDIEKINLPTMRIGKYEVKKVDGYYISIDNQGRRKLNSLDVDDKLFTFLGATHESNTTSSIDKLYFTGNYFDFLELGKGGNINLVYSILSDSSKNLFSKIRFRLLKSEVENDTEKRINTIFSKGVSIHDSDFSSAVSSVDIADVEDKSPSNTHIFKLKNNNLRDYLKIIDRTFIAEANTLNKNGFIGSLVSTLSSTEKDKSKFKHYIGIFALDKLYAMYSYDLAVSKNNDDNTIETLLRENDTKFKDCVKIEVTNVDGNSRAFDWKKYDVRNFLGISNTELSDKIKISNGYQRDRFGQEDENKYAITERKSYGSTMYHNIKEPILTINDSNYSKFIIMKMNLNNYNNYLRKKSRLTPIQLLSINYDTEKNEQIGGQNGSNTKGAFSISLLDGKLYANKIVSQDIGHSNYKNDYTMKYLNYDILEATNLYTDSANFKFDALDYFTFKDYENQIGTSDSVDDNIGATMKKSRDGRENFIILGILLKQNANKLDYEIYSLNRFTTETDGRNLYTQRINKGDINSSEMPIDRIEIGKYVKLMQNPNTISEPTRPEPKNSRDYNKNNIKDVVEVSDIMIFNTENVDKDMKANMWLLYRRYLTKREIERFDESFERLYDKLS